MNKTSFYIFIAASLLCLNDISAQKTPQYFLSKIPVLPRNICEANDKEIMQWNDKILALKNEMIGVEYDEKQQLEQVKANAQPRMDMFAPANAEKIKKLGEEIAIVENKSSAVITEIISFFSEKGGEVEVKYLAIMEPLYQQLKTAQSQRKNTVLIDKKIREAKKGKCKEMSVIRKQYLEMYCERLNELIELGIKGNSLSDEMYRMMYSGFTFRTQYGIWIGFLIGYANELSNVYKDVPLLETEKYN